MNTVKTTLDFLADSPVYDTERPFVALRDINHRGTHKNAQLTNIEWDVRPVLVNDLRLQSTDFTLESAGFQILDHVSSHLRFADIPSMSKYQQETESTLTHLFKADFVLCYDCKLRKNGKFETDTVDINDPLTVELPPKGLHVLWSMGHGHQHDRQCNEDSTFDSSPNVIEQRLNHEEKKRYLRPGNRVRIINTWRPLIPKVEDRPLALCDFRSVATEDLVAVDRIFPDQETQGYYLRYNSRQRFYWISHQTPEELLVMIQYDTKPGMHARYCPHVSFHNTQAAIDAPPRQSVETRSIVINEALV